MSFIAAVLIIIIIILAIISTIYLVAYSNNVFTKSDVGLGTTTTTPYNST